MIIFWWVIFGLISGFLASLILKGHKHWELINDIVFALTGASLGIILMYFAGLAPTNFNIYGLFASIFTIVIFLWFTRKVHL
ncbi:hypothetical protein HY439_01920 [Candidatus Microgenomates bacterium]|nr:hypothetical protein [Candidatus Microgenomates bacterium]